jgi:hypothetical protein
VPQSTAPPRAAHNKVKQYEITAFHGSECSEVSNSHSAFSITLMALVYER